MKHKATSKVQHIRSHLFMVRMWLEDLGEGRTEWRGQVKHVVSGEVRYFREWNNLMTILQEMVVNPEEAAKDAGRTLPAMITPKSDRKPGDG